MQERFDICEIHICPVYKVGESFKPDIEYPIRYCVIDKEKEIAIDIKTKLKYDYVKTMSHLYFMSQSYKKIKGDNRVAILPYAPLSFDNCDLDEAKKIKEQLENNVEFQDGNEVYDNKAYLEYLKQEALKENNKVKNKIFAKMFGKREK
jgi:hypothetical protein